MKMDSEHNSLQASEKRKRISDDVVKRQEYRVAHGLEEPQVAEGEGEGQEKEKAEGQAGGVQDDAVVHERRPLKKWFGIW